MSLIYWPADLPQQVRQSGFSTQLRDGNQRTKTDAGPGKVRRRFSAAARPLACSVLLDRQQLARFERFHDEEIALGSLPFIMPDPIFEGAELDGLLTEGDAPLLIVRANLVRFTEAPQWVTAGPAFQVSLPLSILP